MRILYVAELFPPIGNGGAELSLREMAAKLGRHHEVVVFTPSFGLTDGFQEAEDFLIYRYSNKFTPIREHLPQKNLFFAEMTKHLASFVKRFQPDILHANNAMSAPSVAEVSENYRRVGVVSVRDHRFECFTSHVACASHHDATILEFARCIGNPFAALAYPYARLVTKTIRDSILTCGRAITPSNYLRSELLKGMNIDVRVVYDGVNLEQIRKTSAGRTVHEHERPSGDTLIYGGGLNKYKGIFELLRGFLQVVRKSRDTTLLIAGDGPQKPAVSKFIKENDLAEHIVLLGALPNAKLISLIKGSQLAIVPSFLPEGGSRAVMEALACGVPVVASSRGAVPEMVGDAGIVVEPSALKIAQAISTILEDRSLLRELANRAQRRSAIFSLTEASRKLVSIYEHWLRR